MERIGLFPLSIVLFPESYYPLHIFEERYKKLINGCIVGKEIFGINFITPAKIFDVGCAARIHEVTKVYDDGRLDIVVKGIKRYKIVKIHQSADSFQEGDVEFIEDIDSPLDEILLSACIKLFNEITEIVKSVSIEKIDFSSLVTYFPSFYIAQKAGLTNIQKQKLLELNSENERLSFLNEHLKFIIPLLKESEYISELVKNDGYYNPRKSHI